MSERSELLTERFLDATVVEALGGNERGRVLAVNDDGTIAVQWTRRKSTHVDDELRIVDAPLARPTVEGFPPMGRDPFSRIRGLLPKFSEPSDTRSRRR